MLMSTCWFRDRWHRQTTDRNTSILWYVLSSLMVAGGWWGSCTWSWPVVGAALAARWALTERQEAERAGEPVRCFSLPPSLLHIIHSSISPADTVQWCENKQWRLRRAFAAKFPSWNRTGADRETSAVDPKMRSACVCLQGKVSRQKAKFGPILRVCSCCIHCCLKLHPTFLPAVLLLLPGLSRAQPLLLPGSCNFELGTCGYTSDPEYGNWSMNEEGTQSWNHASNALRFSRVGGSVL